MTAITQVAGIRVKGEPKGFK